MAERWIHPDDAHQGQSYIVSAPWPCGAPFRGEGFREENGQWHWIDGKSIQRPVTAVRELPMPPAKPPARRSAR